MADGTELARLLLRATVGSIMVAHGVRHARSLEGTGRWFGSIGFSHPDLQAKASAVTEIAGGAGLLAGAATPLAAASVIGTMGVAAGSVHAPNGFFITAEGYEYVLSLSVASAALAALGPGRWSVDHLLGVDVRTSGLRAGSGAIGLGLVGAGAHLKAFWSKPTT